MNEVIYDPDIIIDRETVNGLPHFLAGWICKAMVRRIRVLDVIDGKLEYRKLYDTELKQFDVLCDCDPEILQKAV
jgi:hypothetical protein